jgi:predicted acetyltransferase
LLPIARSFGRSRVLATCDEDNLASIRVIDASGGTPAIDVPHRGQGGVRKLAFWIATNPDDRALSG